MQFKKKNDNRWSTKSPSQSNRISIVYIYSLVVMVLQENFLNLSYLRIEFVLVTSKECGIRKPFRLSKSFKCKLIEAYCQFFILSTPLYFKILTDILYFFQRCYLFLTTDCKKMYTLSLAKMWWINYGNAPVDKLCLQLEKPIFHIKVNLDTREVTFPRSILDIHNVFYLSLKTKEFHYRENRTIFFTRNSTKQETALLKRTRSRAWMWELHSSNS